MKKVIQAIPVEILESNGKFYYKLETKKGVIECKPFFSSEGKALKGAERAIEQYYYVGH